MGWLTAVWMIILGILGAANLIIASKPEAKEFIAKLVPYQGWIGAISALWGLWIIIWSILHVSLMQYSVLLWLTFLVEGLVLLSLGLLLGIGLLKTFIKQPQAVEKMDMAVAKLTPYQGTLGIVAIGLGAWFIVALLIWRAA